MKYLNKKVVAVLVVNSIEEINTQANRLLSDGYDVLEVTLRTPNALACISYAKSNFRDVKIGAGTITSLDDLVAAIEAGADFGVSPSINSQVIIEAGNRGFDFIPGVATPSDIETAKNLDVKLVKLFPAEALGGVNYLKAISAPYYDMKFMPTGGINKDVAIDYLSLDQVSCVGGTWMTKSK